MILKHWNKLLTTECKAIKIDPYGIIVYPIFKNGRTSLFNYAKKTQAKIFINEELKNLQHIHVYLRDPEERFISGVHTYIELEKLGWQEETILKQIEQMTICDRHFAPQYILLMHLSKYFKGSIRIDPVSELYLTIPNRDSPEQSAGGIIIELSKERKEKIKKINFENYIKIDKEIIAKHMNTTVNLNTLIKRFYNVLS